MFNYMTGYVRAAALEKLAIAPLMLRSRLVELIDEEIAFARAGRSRRHLGQAELAGRCRDSSTSCTKASQAGVEIDLIIRGICCLRPGVPGLSENIRVKSIVGRFLEHGRIICFGNGHGLPSREAQGLHLLGRLDAAQPGPPDRDAGADREPDRPSSRSSTRSWSPTSRTTAQSWVLEPDGAIRRMRRGHRRLQRPHLFHDQPEPVRAWQRPEHRQALTAGS